MVWKWMRWSRKGARRSEPVRDALGETLLQACKRAELRSVQRLIEQGAPIDAVDPVGLTPLMAALRSGLPDGAACASALVKAGAHVGARAPSGDTALHWAACIGDGASCRMLLAHGARIGDQNDEGECALEVAARMGAEEGVEALWRDSARQSQRKALAWAMRIGHPMAGWLRASSEASDLQETVGSAQGAASAQRL
jgi:ankyrin repeat protein